MKPRSREVSGSNRYTPYILRLQWWFPNHIRANVAISSEPPRCQDLWDKNSSSSSWGKKTWRA